MAGRLLSPLLVSLALAAGSYVAADAARPAGAGIATRATVSGYAVSDPRYEGATDDPSRLAAVRFMVTPVPAAGSAVLARLVRDGAWYGCDLAGGLATCRLDGIDLADVDRLAVTVTR